MFTNNHKEKLMLTTLIFFYPRMLVNLVDHNYDNIISKLSLPKSFMMLTIRNSHHWYHCRRASSKKIIKNFRIHLKKKKLRKQYELIFGRLRVNPTYFYNADFDGDEMNIFLPQ